MTAINHHTALLSLEAALVPAPGLVDSRTEQDWLGFLAEFASLINFYDDNNKLNGNWSPFLLKDPLFLVASISKTRFVQINALFLHTIRSLNTLGAGSANTGEDAAEGIAFLFNRLFDELFQIFMTIKRWIYYMQLAPVDYPLKTYVIQQATTTYSRYFWAIIALRQNLYLSPSVIKGIQPVDTTKFYKYGAFDEITWKQNKEKTPYWDVLGMAHSIKEYPENTDVKTIVLEALTKAGNDLFGFFKNIITRAATEYKNIQTQQNPFPDTTLLRAFVNLLQVQQQQLNSITKKHLSFYYRDILLQQPLPAVADSVIICASLAKPGIAYQLPAGTLFSAGADEFKNPVYFASAQDVYLTPAVINSAYTLSVVTATGELSKLCIENIANPSVVKTSENGKITGWPTFGAAGAQATSLGFVIASPLLFLQDGVRIMTITLTTANVVDQQMFNATSFFVSTSVAWLPLSSQQVLITYNATTAPVVNAVTITITLDQTQPAVETLQAVTSGIDTQWPMLKLVFNAFDNIKQPPVITAINILVAITGAATFQLYNDYGALSTKTPFQLFGPAPAVNSRFMIGSAEIFSKPLATLNLQVNWDVLPPDLAEYYTVYNQYLLNVQPIVPWCKRLWARIKKFFGVKPPVAGNVPLFTNDCFTAGFKLLQGREWVPFAPVQKTTCPPPVVAPASETIVTPVPLPLFPYPLQPNVTPSSCFSYNAHASQAQYIPDPAIQNTPVLKFTDTSTSGFLQIELSGPVYGFGNTMYPNVVSYVSLYNAQLIYAQVKNPVFAKPAHLPFTPKLSGISINYTASQNCVVGGVSDDYPLQCFSVMPFSAQLVYDNLQRPAQTPLHLLTPGGSPETGLAGLPLFPLFNCNGYLFLQMAGVIPGYPVSLYFELAGGAAASSRANAVLYYYLGSNGWTPLNVLADSTNNLSCSGIVTVNIPADITSQYRLAIGTTGDPGSFAQTLFLQTNGILCSRTVATPQIASASLPAGTITKPIQPAPQLSTIVQPFSSFGGKASETEAMMNRRVSLRLKTKDRAITHEDYYRLVKGQFPGIYFSKVMADDSINTITVYVVRSYTNWADAGAFVPFAGKCTKEKIQAFLQQRSSPFYQVQVADPDWQYVQVTATVTLLPGFTSQAVSGNISHALDLYLSPWITGSGVKAFTGAFLSNGQVSAFISGIKGVAAVRDISFTTWDAKTKNNVLPGLTRLAQLSDSSFFVSSLTHQIQCNN